MPARWPTRLRPGWLGAARVPWSLGIFRERQFPGALSCRASGGARPVPELSSEGEVRMTDLLAGDSYRRNRTSAADQVLDDLRSHILSGRLARGTRLPSGKAL